jgi:hypothetical protein
MNCDPFPFRTIIKCSKTCLLLGVDWPPIVRDAVPVTGTGTRAQPWGIGRVDSTRVRQLKLSGKATEPAQNPIIQIMMNLCNNAKGGICFSPAVRESKQL